MKLAISRSSQGMDGARELIESALDVGFRHIQFKAEQLVASDYEFAPLAALHPGTIEAARAGVISYPGKELDSWDGQTERTLGFAREAGSEHVCYVFGSREKSERELRRVVEALHRTGRLFRESGISFSFHNHANSMFGTHAEILTLCGMLDPELCGLTYDTAHAAKCGVTDLAASVAELMPYISNVHLKDVGANGAWCLIGQGTLAIERVVGVLREAGYAGWVVVDEETAGIPCRKACEVSMDYLRSLGVVDG